MSNGNIRCIFYTYDARHVSLHAPRNTFVQQHIPKPALQPRARVRPNVTDAATAAAEPQPNQLDSVPHIQRQQRQTEEHIRSTTAIRVRQLMDFSGNCVK